MAQVTEPRASASTQSTIQDIFLNFARRDRLTVTIHLMDGRHLEARIKNFDKFAVVVEVGWARSADLQARDRHHRNSEGGGELLLTAFLI